MKLFELDTPGPGSYDMSSSFELRGIKTPRARRFSQTAQLSPGPGSYTSRPFTPGTSGTFSTSIRSELFKSTLTPGPGDYDKTSSLSGPAYTFPHKYTVKVVQSPGPGRYSFKFINKKPNSSFIGKAKRPDILTIPDSPGPGRYDVKKSTRTSPSWSLRGKKKMSVCSLSPGPGRYEAKKLPNTGFSDVKSKRPQIFSIVKSPGPGRYKVKDLKSSTIKYSIGKSKRPQVQSITPGPGRYEPSQLSKSFSAKFGNEPKRTLEVISETANVSMVSLKILDKAPAYTFSKKFNVKIDNGGPGPGRYETGKKASTPKVKIGKSFRFIKTQAEKEEIEKPGPGTYEVKRDELKVNIFISRAKKNTASKEHTPGPGRYNIN